MDAHLLWPVGALALVASACQGGARSPEAAEAPLEPVEAALAPDAGCADRARARPLCLQAVEARCASLQAGCEAQCETRLAPGSTEKEPGLRTDLAADRCRERCRQASRGCRGAMAAACPATCGEGT